MAPRQPDRSAAGPGECPSGPRAKACFKRRARSPAGDRLRPCRAPCRWPAMVAEIRRAPTRDRRAALVASAAAPAGAGDRLEGLRQPVAQLERRCARRSSCRRPECGSAGRRRRAGSRATSSRGSMPDSTASASFGPMPLTPISRSNTVSSSGVREAEERELILAHVRVHAQRDVGAGVAEPCRRSRAARRRRSRRRARRRSIAIGLLLEHAPAQEQAIIAGGAAVLPPARFGAARAGRLGPAARDAARRWRPRPPGAPALVQVTDGHRQRIGRVVRRGHGVEPEQQLDHLLHLRLLGPAVADDRALDLGGRVFDDRHAGLDRRQHGDAARVPELQRAAHVGGVEQVLDGDAVGLAVGEQRRPAARWMRASRSGKAASAAGGDGAARHQAVAAAVAVSTQP